MYEIAYVRDLPDGNVVSLVHWTLFNKLTCTLEGRYRDPHYARKQAKRKFRKATKKVEKLLLG